MITYKHIKAAVNQQLKKTGIEINSSDVEEGFNRPSFFVQLDNPKRSGDETQVHKSMTINIYYFPSSRDDYSIEILDVQEKLGYLFDLKLAVNDRLFNIDELSASVVDKVLRCSFDIEFYDGRETIYGTELIPVDSEDRPITDRPPADTDEIPEVIVDDNKDPVLDDEGRVIRIEKMYELDFEKE